MVTRRIVINDHNDEVLKPGDRIVYTIPGVAEGDGPWITVDRDIPDEPIYRPGEAGIATVENNYGVVIPDQAGVWVKRGDVMMFTVLESKGPRRALFPSMLVSNFVPDPTFGERFTALIKERTKERAELAREKRQRALAETALQELVEDLRIIREKNGLPVTTSAGATMQRWLAKRGV